MASKEKEFLALAKKVLEKVAGQRVLVVTEYGESLYINEDGNWEYVSEAYGLKNVYSEYYSLRLIGVFAFITDIEYVRVLARGARYPKGVYLEENKDRLLGEFIEKLKELG